MKCFPVILRVGHFSFVCNYGCSSNMPFPVSRQFLQHNYQQIVLSALSLQVIKDKPKYDFTKVQLRESLSSLCLQNMGNPKPHHQIASLNIDNNFATATQTEFPLPLTLNTLHALVPLKKMRPYQSGIIFSWPVSTFFYEGISIVNKTNEGLMQVATPAQMKRMAVMLRVKNSATDSIYLMAIY